MTQITATLPNLLFFGAAWRIGDIFRIHEEREEEIARQAEINERARIVRELHDVVAHHISVLGIQEVGARRV